MKIFGIFLLVVGSLLLVFGLNFDTTVSSELGRINNIGLMNNRQNILLIAGVLTIVGAIFVATAAIIGNQVHRPATWTATTNDTKKSSDDTKKCPFCAEVIKRDAFICRFCQRDVPHLETVDVEVKSPLLVEAQSRLSEEQKATMERFGIQANEDGDGFILDGRNFSHFVDAVVLAKSKSKGRSG